MFKKKLKATNVVIWGIVSYLLIVIILIAFGN